MKRTDIQNIYALSPMQEGMLFHYQYNEESPLYFEQTFIKIEGSLDIAIFEQAFNALIRKHEVLRTVFTFRKTQKPRQVVFKHRKAAIIFHDLSHLGEQKRNREMERFAIEDRAKGFDLGKDMLMRITLFKTGETNYHAIWSFHHIIMDGWCFGILIRDFMEIYPRLLRRQPLEETNPTPYSAYISWLEQQDKQSGLAYWRDYLGGFQGGTQLPKRTAERSNESEDQLREHELQLDSALTARLLAMVREEEATLNALIMALWGILLSRLTHSFDVVFGCVVSGRPAEIPGIGEMVGLFINTIPMRVQTMNASMTFVRMLRNLQEHILQAQTYEFVPLVEIMEQTPLSRDLFDHILGFENYPLERKRKPFESKDSTFTIKGLQFFERTNYDLSIVVIPTDIIHFRFKYNGSVYRKTFIQQMAGALECMAMQVATEPGIPIHDITLVEEERTLCFRSETPPETVLPLIERHLNETPNQVCVLDAMPDLEVSLERMITMDVLRETSRSVSNKLLSIGCRPGDIVAVSTGRSLEWVIFSLSILQASFVYMPIDINLPDQRKQFMVSDSGCRILLTDYETQWVGEGVRQFTLSELLEDGDGSDRDPRFPFGDDPAYLIYTSGSTGRPKGVLMEHGAAANFYKGFQVVYEQGFARDDRCLASTGIGFDVSVAEWLTPLCSGSTMILLPDHWRKDARTVARLLIRQSVTFSYIPPALLEDVRRRLSRSGHIIALNKLLVGVEPIDDSVLEGYVRLNPSMTVINGYGPTEATICATMYRYVEGSSIGGRTPIGTQLPNTTVVLKDNHLHPVPHGLPGEIYIAGRQLARGYLNNPELTAERFIQDIKKPRMYRTGDRACVLSDGNLEFIGRFDKQVKTRGFRIELGEIEMVLRRHPDVQNAVAMVVERSHTEPFLCAYVVAAGKELLDEGDLRVHLAKFLPDYMIPASIMSLQSFPLTPNGKIDRRSLPLPSEKDTRTHVPAEGPVQTALAKIWSEVLDIPKGTIGIDDNFFSLGGHSLKAAAVASRIYKDLEVNIPLRQLFHQPFIRAAAQYIERQTRTRFSGIPVAEKREYYPLSSAQKRLLVVTGMADDTTSYNMPFFLELKGEFDIQRLRTSFKVLLRRHQSLRTSFRLHGSETVQVIVDHVQLEIPFFKKDRWPVELERNFVRPFDLSTAPLMRVCLGQIEGDRHLLLIDMHHIITDGTSIGILLKEFMTLYSGDSLPELQLAYCDYTLWQEARRGGKDLLKHERFWLEQFSDPPPALNLPFDYPRPHVKDFAGDVVRFQCEQFKNPFESTLFSLLLSVYYVLLTKLSGQEDIVVGVPTTGRPHPDLESIIGMLVNTLALRNFPLLELRFEDFLRLVANNTIKAFEHQDFQLDELVAKLPGPHDPGRNPLFDSFFVFQNMEIPTLALQELEIIPRPHPKTTAKFDLLIEGTEANETIFFALEYSTSLFSKKTAQRIAGYFRTILNAVLDHPDALIGELDILSPEEKREILSHANGPDSDLLPYSSIHEWFSATANSHLDHIAIMDQQLCISYSFINSVSDRGASLIASRRPPAEAVIGLLEDAGAELLIGILAILKAGCVYMPIDPQYPAERKRYMVTDSAAFAILTGTSDIDIHWLPKNTVNLSINAFLDEDNPSSQQSPTPFSCNEGTALYVIYTSGSTGFPKGVILQHGNLMNLILFQMRHTTIDACRVLQFASPGFDVSMQEIFSTLLAGGCLCFMDHRRKSDLQTLWTTISRYGVHTVYLPTSFLKFLFGKGQEGANIPSVVSHIVTAGEQLVISPHFRRFLESRRVMLHNHYGPSETHVVTALTIGPQNQKPEIPSIGRAITNTAIYILDRQLNLQPSGVAGELWVAGRAVGRGYLNRPELSQEKFSQLSLPQSNSIRAYRTGDLARSTSDGTIEFLGRVDNQVKIRGFRVEPGEIESRLLNHPSLKEAIVIHRNTKSGENYLCAYITANPSSGDVTTAQLKSYLAGQLPNYMIPAFFVQMESIPLTVNGKLNRALLPEPGIQKDETTPPRQGTETLMASIWSEILDVDVSTVSRDANFFECGGHSLKATMLVAHIHQVFEVKLLLQEIFKYPVLKAMAKTVDAAASEIFKAIPSIEKMDYYPLSSAQKRMFVLNQLKKGHISDNISLAVLVEGERNIESFSTAFQSLCSQHEALRTWFEVIDRQPVQRIHDRLEVTLEEMEGCNREEALKAFIRPFDLSSPPLFRVGLRQEDPLHHVLVLDMHHIITDGLSIKHLLRDFIALLNRRELPELRIQYKDFARWQEQSLKRGILKQQEEFWLDVFSDRPPTMELPYDFPPSDETAFEGGNIDCLWEGWLAEKIQDIVDSNGTTLYMVLLALFNILLSRYSGEEDIVVGSPVAGRRHPDVEGIVGFFVNTLAMRNRPLGEKSFLMFLGEVREGTIQALQNQDFQFEELVGRLGLVGQYHRNPLFDTMLSIENTGVRKEYNYESTIEGLRFTPIDSGKHVTQFDLTLQAYERDGQIGFNLRYSSDRFHERTIRRFIQNFNAIAESVSTEPGILIRDIDALSPIERKFLLDELNQNELSFDSEVIFPLRFARQAEVTPDHMALAAPLAEGNLRRVSQITFKELRDVILLWAEVLKEYGVGPDCIVAFIMEPSLEMIITILAILEAGGAYLPISTSFPPKRVRYILRDSAPRLIITDKKRELDFDGSTLYVQHIANISTLEAGISSSSLLSAGPEAMAYIIYTSGSTGKPKGVVVRHDNLLLQLVGFIHRFQLRTGIRTLLSTAVTFDASVILIFPPLMSGGSLVVVPENTRKDSREMIRVIEREAIDTMCVVPAYMQALLENANPNRLRFKRLLIGGDVFSTALYDKLDANPNIQRVVNVYGPTETTVDALVYSCATGKRFESSSLPIGRAIPNYKIAIRDRYHRQVPIGVVGEIWIGGGGVSAGYLNRPESTSEVFTQDANHERWYKTGDRGLVQDDGNIMFLGRVDFQVKIRGFRVETGDITASLLGNPMIKNAMVVAVARNEEDTQLHAFVVPHIKEELDVELIIEALSAELPDYMIPRQIAVINELPLNSSGKVDRNALIAIAKSAQRDMLTHIPPRTQSEHLLARFWAEILSLEKKIIGRDDNFFHLGGHSLNAAVLSARLNKRLGVDLPMLDLFKNPSLRLMAQLLDNTSKSGEPTIIATEKKDYYHLSSPQKRFYFVEKTNPDTISYNMAALTRVTGTIDRNRLKWALDELCGRHESFRTCFYINDGQPVQRVRDTVVIDIEEFDGDAVDEAVRAFIRPFILEQAPLFRIGVITTSSGDCVLALDMHHIIGDGVSMDVLIADLAALYAGDVLARLSIQYRDFALWQEEMLQSERFQKQIAFWKKRLVPPIPVLDLQPDFKRPAIFEHKGCSFPFELEPDVFLQLSQLTRKLNTTMYMLLAAIFALLLEKYSRQEDILIGSVVAGRRHEELENVIGLFTNTIPLRFFVRRELRFDDFARAVNGDCIEAFDNQDVPFEELVTVLNPQRDPSRNPLFDVGFGMMHAASMAKHHHELTFTPYPFEAGTSKFDLSLLAEERNNCLSFLIEYRTDLFNEATIQGIARHFMYLTRQIAAEPDIPIEEFSLLSDQDKFTILDVFNRNGKRHIPRATFWELFVQAKNITPNALAVTLVDRHLTFKALGELASGLAEFLLRQHHLQKEDRVGILMKPSLEWAVSLVAVMKAGCATIPLEPELPEERIRFMCEDSAAGVVMDREFFLQWFNCFSRQSWKCTSTASSFEEDVDHIAYIIYTSGTTGSPKGVAVTHRGFAALQCFQREELGIVSSDRVLQFARISFDGAMFELASALFHGAGLCIPRRDIIGNFTLMEGFLQKAGITVAVLPPPYLAHLSSDLRHHLRILVSAGSEASDALVRRWGGETCYFNGYGPTEATVAATIWRYLEGNSIDRIKSIPIGKPIPGTRVFIIGRNHRLLPPLVPGELCIAGSSLARGYLNNPELTDQVFVNTDEGFVYKSGDLARFLPDGNLEFLGRIDQQVKIRGQRVELLEIEHQILRFPNVSAATVVLWSPREGDYQLAAYFVPADDGLDTDNLVGQLSNQLAKRLPNFMVPSHFVPIEEIPLTVNGKVDHGALPIPQVQPVAKSTGKPRNETEARLAVIWSEVLEIPLSSVGIESDFFQLGGHSLKLTMLLSRILKEMKVTIPLVTTIAEPTIRGMARYIIQNSDECILNNEQGLALLKKGKKGGRQHHLFLVHDGFGRIEDYRELAHQANEDQWIWGIEMDIPSGPEKAEVSIQDIAASYIRKIDAIEGLSKCLSLGGWSLGGIIAFEMAIQLEGRGDDLHNLVLFDTIPPFVEKSYLNIEDSYLSSDIILVSRGVRCLVNASRHYVPGGKLNTPVLFIDAIQSPHPAKKFWKNACEGLFRSVSIECSHHQLFQPINTEKILNYTLPMLL